MSAGGDIFESWFTGDLAFSRDDPDDKEGASVVWLDGAAVAKALADLTLPLMPGKDMEWLAMAVRRSLAFTMRSASNSPDRTSDAQIRGELQRLAALAGSTWLELFQCNLATDSRLLDYAWHHSGVEAGTSDGDGETVPEPYEYRRYRAALIELDWLSSFMREAAKATEVPRKQWRIPEQKALRIERGQFLAPVFEAAFGSAVSANNWPSGKDKKATAFMDFYQKMVELAFGEHATPNISAVLKEACRLHRLSPVQFAKGRIPGLSGARL